MKQKPLLIFICFFLLLSQGVFRTSFGQERLTINDQGYFEMTGLDVIVFDDYYPIGRQGGVTIIQNGERVAANGDITLQGASAERADKKVDRASGTIQAHVNLPDIPFSYNVTVKSSGNKVTITADLSQPLPPAMEGKAYFQIELFPAILFGKSWNMDGKCGFFPTDSYGPMTGTELVPYAEGKVLTIAPETDEQRMTIRSLKGDLLLEDGRKDSKARWFLVRTPIPAGQTKGVIEWEIDAAPLKDYVYKPVIHISQVGYLPAEPKRAVIEMDKRTTDIGTLEIYRINPDGTKTQAFSATPNTWGKFLRYNYAVCDFSSLREPGIYMVKYGEVKSNIFKIGNDIYERYVWQPIIEYFLPVQMCHMRVEQGSRVWHNYCHFDDALMAPVNHMHFDGYRQGPETFVDFKHPQHVPELDRGGWHDAGDYDLRVESQAVTTWRLVRMYELFNADLDVTTIDQQNRITIIHKPDGIPDALQQAEHGIYTILGGWKGLGGRLYRGIISPTRKQYGLTGDGSAQTDNLNYDRTLQAGAKTAYTSSLKDDRWVFTEDNARHELVTAATLAATARVFREWRPETAAECLAAAEEIFNTSGKKDMVNDYVAAAAELYITTKNKKYLDALTSKKDYILSNMKGTAWAVGMVYKDITDQAFRKEMDKAVKDLSAQLDKENESTPFGVPYKPNVWGDGWTIQSQAVQHYFLVTGFPGVFKPDRIFNAAQFMMGCHPGSNTASFASGVGNKSITAGYGVNRADLSYIPGGVASGTAIIRPDFPEMKDNWSFLWQQTEYVLGGGATNFSFLVLATEQLLGK
ncbi:MAG: glycoside hydrolase family 9 protein [Bacteroidales bacterium]|jgi:hypothetical protein|nr:glycoside hydrolase family 9 protein [Bacteroidales bacterium]